LPTIQEKLRYLIIIGLLILNFSCKTQKVTPELKNNFSSEQIADLQKIMKFFKNRICIESKSDFGSCFEPMLPKLIETGYEPIFEKINFNEQLELYKSISKNTFNEIWTFCKTRDLVKNTEYQSLCAKGADGKYSEYLLEVGKKNKFIKNYAEKLIASGDFEPSGFLQSQIYTNKSEFNFKDPNIQLIIAIHFLTINDQQKRN